MRRLDVAHLETHYAEQIPNLKRTTLWLSETTIVKSYNMMSRNLIGRSALIRNHFTLNVVSSIVSM